MMSSDKDPERQGFLIPVRNEQRMGSQHGTLKMQP